MKTAALLIIILFTGASLSAQNKNEGEPKNKTSQVQQTSQSEQHILDKLQKETEDISAVKPLLFIASIIEERLELRRLGKESIAAAKSRETGMR